MRHGCVQPQTANSADIFRLTMADLSGGNIWLKHLFDERDAVFQIELSLLHSLQQQLIQRLRCGQLQDHLVEIAMLDLKIVQPRAQDCGVFGGFHVRMVCGPGGDDNCSHNAVTSRPANHGGRGHLKSPERAAFVDHGGPIRRVEKEDSSVINVVFNNPMLYVVDYSGKDAIEIIDKRSGRVGLVRGALANRFRHDFGILVAEQADEERFEDFIESYDAVMNQSARWH
jgi:hypothetical protein